MNHELRSIWRIIGKVMSSALETSLLILRVLLLLILKVLLVKAVGNFITKNSSYSVRTSWTGLEQVERKTES